MISIPLQRDEARMIEQSFLPYMISLAESKMKGLNNLSNEYLNCRIFLSLLLDVQLIFKRKLLLKNNKLKINFSDAHGIAFYIFIMLRPIDADQVYILMLRQRICDKIHQQLSEPVTDVQLELEA